MKRAFGLILSVCSVVCYCAVAVAYTPGQYTHTDRITVLPVLFVPADEPGRNNGSLIPDPDVFGNDLNGDPISSDALDDYERAITNLSGHLFVAQEKYRRILKTPGGQDRGTFALSRWDHATDEADLLGPADVGDILEPLIVRGVETHSTYALYSDWDIAGVMTGEVLDALGYSRYNCPFIFAVFYVATNNVNPVHDTTGMGIDTCGLNHPGGIGGNYFNIGLNGGLGMLQIPYRFVVNSNASTTNFMSTFIHELGHTFGLRHSWHYVGAMDPPPDEADDYLYDDQFFPWGSTLSDYNDCLALPDIDQQ